MSTSRNGMVARVVGRVKRRDKQAAQPAGGATQPKRLLVEALEPRLLLSGGLAAASVDAAFQRDSVSVSLTTADQSAAAPSAGDALLGLAPVVASLQGTSSGAASLPSNSARNADLLEIDLAGWLTAASSASAPLSYDIRAVGIEGAVIAQIAPDEYAVAARNADGSAGAAWGRLILAERYDAQGAGFASTGRMLFAPSLPDPRAPVGGAAAPFTGSFALSYAPSASSAVADAQRFQYQSGRQVSVFTIRDNTAAPDAEDAVGSGIDPLSVLRLQQRLRALGYTGVTGQALAVDGKLGANTRYAIGQFNALVDGLNTPTPGDNIATAWINDPQAPRAGTVLSTPLPRRPGVQEQAAIAQAVVEGQRIFDQVAQGTDWAAAVPMLDGKLGELLPLAPLAKVLMQATIGSLAAEPSLSQADLLRLLSSPKSISINVAQSDGTTKVVDYSFGLKAGTSPSVVITDAAITIDKLELTAQRSDAVLLNLGADAAALGLKLVGSTTINLAQSWTFKLGLEIKRDLSLPTSQAVVFHALHLDGALEVMGADNLNARLRIGSMDGSVVAGTVNQHSLKVSAGLQAGALGISGLSLVQLGAAPLSGVTEADLELRIKAQLPVTLDNSTAKQTLYLGDVSATDGALLRKGGDGTLAAVTLDTLSPNVANLRFAAGANSISLAELGSTDTSQMLAMLDKLRDALNAMGTSIGHAGEGSPLQLAWPDIEVPLLGTLKWPDLSTFLRLGDWIELPDLPQTTSSFDLPSWQDIAKQLPGFSLTGNAFDAAAKSISYAVRLDQSLGQWTTRIALGDGDQSVPAPLTADTAVAGLNGGGGIADLSSGLASLRVALRSGASFDVVLAGASTLQQFIALIETASRSNAADAGTQRVRVRLGSQADRLVIEDNTSGSSTFTTTAINGLKTAAAGSGLGLLGEDVDGDGSITGAELVGASGSVVNASARIKGNFNITMDLSPLGRGFTVSGKTLAELNGGAGLVAGAANGADDIRISLHNGSVVGVNLSGLVTVADLLSRLNAVPGLKAGVALTQLVAESSTSDAWNALDSSTRAMKGETARLWLQDTTASAPGSSQIFKVEAANGSLRGAAYIGLGLLGVDIDGDRGQGDGIIAGATLHGDTLENHLFISDQASLKASIELSVPDIDARLQVDGLAIGVQNGSAQLRAELPLVLRDPGLPAAVVSTDAQGISTFTLQSGSASNRGISLAELIGALGDAENKVVYSATETSTRLQRLVGNLALKGSATLDLPVVVTPAVLLAGATNPSISVNWTDLSNAATRRTETRGLNLLQGLRNFAFSDLLANLQEVQHQLQQLEAQATYQQALPLLGHNLADIVSLSDQFGRFIDALALHPVNTVAQLQGAIQQALAQLGTSAGSASSTASAATAYSQTDQQSVIQLGLNFETRGSTTVPIDLNLAALGAQSQIKGINGNLLSSQRGVTLAWLGALNLNLDIDVSNPLAPVVYLRDSSRARFGLGLDEGHFKADSKGQLTLVDGLDADAALGPLGLLVAQGTVRLNDGSRILAVDPAHPQQSQVRFDHLASWTADVHDETGPAADGRYRVGSEFKAGLLDTSTAGRIDVVLPIKLRGEPRALDAATPDFALHLADLARLTNAASLRALADSTDASNLVRVPNFSPAVAGLGALNGDLSTVWDGIGDSWTAAFDSLDTLLAQGAFNVPLPMIGAHLADSVGFVRDLRDALAPVLGGVVGGRTSDMLRSKVLEALRPWIKDHDGNGVIDGDLNGNGVRDANEDFVALADADHVEFDLEFYGNTQLAGADIGFDLGLPGLGLQLDGSVRLDLGFSWKFGFGVSRTDGFYLKLPDAITDDLRVDLTATLPGFAANGKLGFLAVKATDDADSPSHVQGSFIVDLKDPSHDQKLTVSDLRSGASIGQMFDARFSGEALVNLDLETSFQGSTSFPRVAADLAVSWVFAEASTQSARFGGTPTVTFDHVRFNAGDFINGLLKPLITQVKSVIDPIQPALDFLTKPLPGISDLLGAPTTLLDVAQALGAPNIDKVRKFVDQVQYLSDLVNTLAATTASGWIEVGSMTVDTDVRQAAAPGKPLARTEQPKSAADVSAQMGKSGGKSLIDNASSSKGGFAFPLLSNPTSLFGILLGQDVTLVTYDTPALHARMPFSTPQFPVLSPIVYGSVYGAIGLDTRFSFGYDTAGIKRYGQTGDPLDLANGFYVNDLDSTGRDVAELSLSGEIGLQASLNKSLAPVVKAGASGGLRAQIDFNLDDPNHDGKVRLDEIVRNLNLGPAYVFDTSGRIDFTVKAWFWMGADLPKPIGKVTLGKGSVSTSIKILDLSVPRPDNTPRLAALDADGTLTLNMGDRAGLRANGNVSDGDETFRLSAGNSADSVVVEAFGFSKTYTGVKRIVGDAGKGNDTVQVGAGLALQSITLHGGSGDDKLTTAGSSAVRFYGDAGVDQLTGADGNDVLDGGDDNDLISGGAGDDTLSGGGGNDQLQGGLGNDTIDGGSGDDVIAGDAGNDVLSGGDGADVIAGGNGNDELNGGGGDDSLDGGQDDDTLFGDDGQDHLAGGDGYDYLDGGDGDDVLLGERGGDTLFGGNGNDQLWGGLGNDLVAGGAGNDTLFGGEDRRGVVGGAVTAWGIDTLVGGQGSDLIVAGSGVLTKDVAQVTQIYGDDRTDSVAGGDDVIYGSDAADVIRAGSGNDIVMAYGGDDTIVAGAGNDTVDAGDGNDTVVGGSGSDVLDGGNGSDLIWGGQELVALSLGQLVAGNPVNGPAVLELPPETSSAAQALAFGATAAIMPVAVSGQSQRDDGADAQDGADTLRGGAGRDWIFGGGGDDNIDAGAGQDYVDGGAGNDTLQGGDDADVLRGGDGDDELHGNGGADLLLGEAGRDTLWGDDTPAPTLGAGQAQRLYGGDGDDTLYAWSANPIAGSAADSAEAALLGDQLFGGAGRDTLYGGLRRDTLDGGAGADVLLGDAVASNTLLSSDTRRLRGGADVLLGGSGEDVLQGGGGDDELHGGGDADRLEGQAGSDRLYGDSGSDALVVDLDPAYGAASTDWFDGHGDASTPDNGIDRFLITGTAGNDRLVAAERLGAQGQRLLVVQRRDASSNALQAESVIDWRAAPSAGSNQSAPRVEQFQWAGLAGDDRLGFAAQAELDTGALNTARSSGLLAVDLTDLSRRGSGWVSVMEGGAGNDRLDGSDARDYLDGGAGSDQVYGNAGDDQLWGDADNLGTGADRDQLYGGLGNDDLYAGSGATELFAWSVNPYRTDARGNYLAANGTSVLAADADPALRTWLGVYTDASGLPVLGNGDANGDGKLDSDPSQPARSLEATGLNRMIGGPAADRLYGGTGLDALIGKGGTNTYLNRDGQSIQSVGDVVFNLDPDHKVTGGNSSGFWAYGGSNVRDQIRVDFVTEPGLLTGHHLITRLTENAGNFSFDASVRLDLANWTTNNLFSAAALINSDDVDGAGTALGQGTEQSRSDQINTLLASLLNGEEHLTAIYIDAMAGNDDITVGPTVQTSVWINAGDGDDHVVIEPGRAILTDLADQQGSSAKGRNDSADTAYTLAGTAGASVYAAPVRFTDLTLDSPTDTDWFRFNVGTTTTAAGIAVTGLSADDGLGWKLYRRSTDAQGRVQLGAVVAQAAGARQAAAAGLTLTAGDYLLQVSGNRVPTRYDLQFDLGNTGGVTPVALGVAPSNEIRHDLLLGGAGNDVLIGGPGEDYIAGGDGNDVLSGGADRQSVDVMDGGAGDDTFQIWTDALALDLTTGVPQTPGIRSNDVFIGGAGQDRALLLGGDLDDTGRPINDWATVRYSATNQRYELAAKVWDTANQRFMPNAAMPGQDQLQYAYFRLESTEQIAVQLQAGQDTFHADPGFKLPDGTEWGLSQADRPAGAPVIDITASGGDGADLIVGGDGDDHLSGDAGDDFLVGGGGDDHLDGGSGNDALYGGTTLDQPADRFEWVLRGGQLGANDAPSFATDVTDALDRSSAGQAKLAATFHAGDGFDWYLVRVATSLRNLSATALTSQVAAGLSANSADVQVFLAEVGKAADGSISSVRTAASPVDKTYVLLRVANNPKVVSTTTANFVPFGSTAIGTLVDGQLVVAVAGEGGSKYLGLARVSPSTGVVTRIAGFNEEVTLKATGEPTQVQITALPSGGFAVSWVGPTEDLDPFDYNAASARVFAASALKLQRFDASGQLVGSKVKGLRNHGYSDAGSPEFIVMTGYGDGNFAATHRAVALPNDTVVLTWSSHVPKSGGVNGDFDDDRGGAQLVAISSANRIVEKRSWASFGDLQNLFDATDVTSAANGTWASVWSAAPITRGFSSPHDILTTGQTEVKLSAASEVVIATYQQNPYRAPQIQTLTDGNLLVMWIGGSATDTGTEISTRVYDTSGRAVTATQRLALASDASGLDLIQLADGRVLGRWNNMARFIDAQGRGVGDVFALPADAWTADATGNFALLRAAGGAAAIDQYSSVRDYSVTLNSAVVDAAAPPRAATAADLPTAEVLPQVATSAPVQEWLGSNTGLGLGSASVPASGSTLSVELAAPQSVGDFNGDGREDFLVSDAFYSYLFLEPTVFGTSQDIASSAQVVIDRAIFGTPGVRMGDLDGDGRSDLVFANGKQVNVLRGSASPVRKPVSADWSAVFSFNPTRVNDQLVYTPVYGDLITAVADYKDATPGGDLVVLMPSSTGLTGNTALQIGAIGSISGRDGWSQSVSITQVPVAGDEQTYRLLVANLNGGDRQDLLIAHGNILALLDGGNASATVDLQTAYRRWDLSATAVASSSGVLTPDLHLLGDINGDRLDDVALSFRYQVNKPPVAPVAAAVLLGSTNLATGTLGFATLVQDPADNAQAQGDVNTLYTVTAGDFDGDGKVDLAVGRPLRSYPIDGVLIQNTTGTVSVFKSIASGASTRSMSSPDAPPLTGTGTGNYFGILPRTPALDIDGDGRADLLVTAPFAETFVDGVSSTGGVMRNYADVLGRSTTALPSKATRVANFQDKFLLGNDEGQPNVLSSQNLTADRLDRIFGIPTSYADNWYRFVLPGGGDDSNASIVLDQSGRLTGSAGSWALSAVPLRATLFDSGGRAVSANGRAISLAGLAAGEYFLRVEDTSVSSYRQKTTFSITFNLSNPNRDAPLRDRDELVGGAGVDRLVGGGQIDRLVGGAGIDIVRGESMEFIDRSGDVLIAPTARDPQAAGNSPTQLASATVAFADANLASQVRSQLGLASGAPLRRSDMARLTDLDLSDLPVKSLAGLEAATNLESLKLNNLATGGQTISLAPLEQLHRLRVLSARNASIASPPALDGMTSLQVLDLANNSITSLTALTGQTVVDDDLAAPARYQEDSTAVWLSGRLWPAVGGDYRYTDGSNGAASATWTVPSLQAGEYTLEISRPVVRGLPPVVTLERGGTVLMTGSPSVAAPLAGTVTWVQVGRFSLASDGAGDGLVVRTAGGGVLVADAVRITRRVSLPAQLSQVDLTGNALLSRAEIEVGGAALLQAMTAQLGTGRATVLLPAAAVADARVTTPDFVEFTGPSFAIGPLAKLSLATSAAVVSTGTITSITGEDGRVYNTVGHVEFEVVSAGNVTFTLQGNAAGGVRAPSFYLFSGSSPSTGGTQIGGRYDMDRLGSTSRQFTVSLQPGTYSIEVSRSTTLYTAAGARAGLWTSPDVSSTSVVLYGVTVTGQVRSLSATSQGVAVTPTLAWLTTSTLNATVASNQLTLASPNGAQPIGEVGIGNGSLNGPVETIRTVSDKQGLVFGTVFSDANADGQRQADESGLEGVWVGIDFNGNGRVDDEARRVGAYTDYRGRYVIDLRDLSQGGTDSSLPATARLLATTYFNPLMQGVTLTDSVGLPARNDSLGPRDLGVTSWGLPARVVAQEGTPLVLNAPTTLLVGGTARSDLSYRWFVFANAADSLNDTNRLAVVDGKQLSLNLLAPYARTIVAAAFEPTVPNPGLAQALTKTTIEVPTVLDRANTESTVRVLAPVALSEADVVPSAVPRVVDLRAALPYVALPNPAADKTTFQTVVTISDASQALPADRWNTATRVDGSSVALDSPKLLHTGAYLYEARLLDKATGQLLEQFRWTVTVQNQAPTLAPPNGLQRALEGDRYIYRANAVDPGGDQLSYAWQVTRSGQLVASGSSHTVDFTPDRPGQYQVSMAVDDKRTEGAAAGLTTTQTFALEVLNLPPRAIAIDAATGLQFSPVNLTVRYLDGADPHRFTWTLVEAQTGTRSDTVTTVPAFSFTPRRPGNYQVSVQVEDFDGVRGFAGPVTATVPVANALPTLSTNLSDRTAVEGSLLSFTASGADGTATQGGGPVTYAWTAALGTTVVASATTADFSFTPPNQDLYAVTVRVTDQDGGAVSSSATVTVANKAPVVGPIAQVDSAGTVLSAAGSTLLQVAEGQPVFVKVAATDVPADTLTYDWALLDSAGREMTTQRTGATWQLPASVNGAALQAGQYTVRVVVSDGTDAAPAVVRGLQFTNVAPAFSVPPSDVPARVLGDGAVTGTFQVRFDGGASDTLRAEVAWGDGDVDSLDLQAVYRNVRVGPITIKVLVPGVRQATYSHAYTAKSTDPLGWQPTVTVSDEEGSVSSSFRVLVTDGPKLTRTGGAALANLTEGVAGSWASYVLALSGAPNADVRVDLLADDQLEFWDRVPTDPARVAMSSVTFTAASFGPRTVYVTARNDDTIEASAVASVIRHRVVTTDPRVRFQLDQAGGTPAELNVTTVDDDLPGVVVTPVGTLQTTEAGGTAQFDIQLAKQPTADVVIDLYSSNSAEGRVSSNAVRFTPQTWNTAQRITVTGVGDGGATSTNDAFEVRFAGISGDARYAALAAPAALSLTNLNVAPTLKVSNLVATTSGFTIEFNQAVDVGAVNLYEATDPTERTGSPDITVARVISTTSSVAVTGSLVFDASGRFATFVQRGGALTTGNYTVTVRGDRLESDGFASRGVRTAAGGQSLDGDANGTAGGDYVGSFTVAAFSGATLSLADFARGPGQAVNVPAANAGLLPLLLNTGGSTTTVNVSAIDVVLKYDPAQLKINSVLRGAALPADADLSFNLLAESGELRIVVTRNTPFALVGTALELLKIDATVPASARYGVDQVLDLSFKLNGGALNARADDAVHLAAYLGDVTGDRQYGALDVQRVSRVAGGLDTGFAPFARTSPLLIADITQSAALPRPDGFIGAADKQALLDVTLGGTRVEIPALPQADSSRPSLTLNSVSVAAGAQASLTMSMVQVPLAAQKVTVRIAFDDNALSFVRSRRGDLALGFDDVNVTRGADGRAIVEVSVLLRSQHLATGVLGLLDFKALAPAAGRTLAIDVISLSVDDGRYPLGQAPVSGQDAADGKITVAAAATPLRSMPVALAQATLVPALAAPTLPDIGMTKEVGTPDLQIDLSGGTGTAGANLLLDSGKRRSWLTAALAKPVAVALDTVPAKHAEAGMAVTESLSVKSSAARRAAWISRLAPADKQVL